jgi:hypothetical protein
VLFLSGQNTDFDLMWNTLFSQNELEMGETAYLKVIKNFLQYFSDASIYEQRVLVAGHIGVKDGYTEVGPQQLRVASCTHAFPKRSARYLIMDCEKEIKSSSDLVPNLRYVFEGEPVVSLPPIKSA